MYERKIRYEYIGVDWQTREELVAQLNTYTNDGWIVDAHRISSDASSGWTVYRRSVSLNAPLLERSISVGKVYEIFNRVVDPFTHPEMSHDFDAGIKAAVRQELDV
jgi:hypothetical protein